MLEFLRKDLDSDKEVHSLEVKNAKDSIAKKSLIKKPVNKVHVARNDARVNNVPAKKNLEQLNKIKYVQVFCQSHSELVIIKHKL